MIAMLFAWLALLILSAGLGGPTLRLFNPPGSLGQGPRFFLSLWLGLFLWATLFLLLAPLTPLQPWIGWSALALSSLLLLHPRHPCRSWVAAASGSPAWIIGVVAIPLLLLPVCLQPVTNTDSVSYHYDIIAWLSQLGTVPGIAQIHGRFAYISIWFTFPALLNHGPLEARLTGAAGGFAAVVATGQIYWTLVCFLTRGVRSDHLFAGAAMFLAILFPTFLNISASPAHDYPVAIVTVLTAWSLLLTRDSRAGRWRYLSVVLASFAISLKLSTLPVLAIAGLVGLWRAPDKVRFFLTSAVLGGVLIMPWIINQILISGWPIFPLGVPLPLPWTLPHEEVLWQANRVRQYVPWHLLDTEGLRHTLAYWFRFDRTHPPSAIYMAVGAAATAGLLLKRKELEWNPWPLIWLGGLGTFFWLYTTAHPRFGWGYLALLPAAAVFLFPPALRRLEWLPLPAAGTALLWILVSLAVPTFVISTRSEKMLNRAAEDGIFPTTQWLPLWTPPLVPNIHYPDGSDAAIYFEYPVEEENLMPMPVRPLYHKIELKHTLQFRRPEAGLRGGFIPREESGERQKPLSRRAD